MILSPGLIRKLIHTQGPLGKKQTVQGYRQTLGGRFHVINELFHSGLLFRDQSGCSIKKKVFSLIVAAQVYLDLYIRRRVKVCMICSEKHAS